jgi:hypothetical protein
MAGGLLACVCGVAPAVASVTPLMANAVRRRRIDIIMLAPVPVCGTAIRLRHVQFVAGDWGRAAA